MDGGGFGDDDGLGVEELAHAGGGEFAAVAGALDAAEGQARVAGDDGVEEDGAGLEFDGEALRSASSVVQAVAARPKGVSLARSMASSSEATRKSRATGPKISSWAMGALRMTPAMTVGWK